MDDKTFENRAQMGPKTEHRRGTPSALGHDPMGYPRVPREKNRKNSNATKKRVAFLVAPPFDPKKWPTWFQVGSQVGAKMDKKSIQKSFKKLVHLGMQI